MNRHKPNGIERAIQAAGSLRALAKRMQVARYTVAYWRDKGVPAHRVKAIVSAVNGAVTAHDLRPDLW